ncbi:hypothetical protein BJ944DRAFT_269973 [Cunninghamella echinulata]|nr:hypothetical protein BJ944DRAFT_269973 [Cunninghamella echinulata]
MKLLETMAILQCLIFIIVSCHYIDDLAQCISDLNIKNLGKDSIVSNLINEIDYCHERTGFTERFKCSFLVTEKCLTLPQDVDKGVAGCCRFHTEERLSKTKS